MPEKINSEWWIIPNVIVEEIVNRFEKKGTGLKSYLHQLELFVLNDLKSLNSDLWELYKEYEWSDTTKLSKALNRKKNEFGVHIKNGNTHFLDLLCFFTFSCNWINTLKHFKIQQNDIKKRNQLIQEIEGKQIFDQIKNVSDATIFYLLDKYYSTSKKKEEAENENKTGTVNSLTLEISHIKNALNREIIELLDEEADKILSKINESIFFSDEFYIKYSNYKKAVIDKNLYVKGGEFEKASDARVKEKELIEEIKVIINNIHAIKFKKIKINDGTIVNVYSIVKLLLEYSDLDNWKKYIEVIQEDFSQLYFLKLSKEKMFISPYKFTDESEVIKKAIQKIIEELKQCVLRSIYI